MESAGEYPMWQYRFDEWLYRLQLFNWRINVLDWNIKQVGCFLAAVAASLTVFGQTITRGNTTASLERKADKVFKGAHPDYFMAQLDGYNDWNTISAYTSSLNSLTNYCWESRDSIGILVYSVAKQHKDAGYETTYYGILESFLVSAQERYTDEKISCLKMHNDWTSGLKQK